MDARAEEFLQTYLEEAESLLEDARGYLSVVVGKPRDEEAIAGLHRVFHTLKSSAGLMGFGETRAVAAAVERLLAPANAGEVPVCERFRRVLENAREGLVAGCAHIARAHAEDAGAMATLRAAVERFAAESKLAL